jgi:hypothetical protein
MRSEGAFQAACEAREQTSRNALPAAYRSSYVFIFFAVGPLFCTFRLAGSRREAAELVLFVLAMTISPDQVYRQDIRAFDGATISHIDATQHNLKLSGTAGKRTVRSVIQQDGAFREQYVLRDS